ncbi:Acetylglutamate kinase [invertebrate metagenome]|uniref:acetylglutamate kinase n=1 Tax=invertebrate metagenome TaxID=1711999 RepID=A0A484H9N4_9ZZZZ
MSAPVQTTMATERDIWLAKTQTLVEALPYMRAFSGGTFVVKYGGHAMGEDHLAADFARDVVLLKQIGIHPVVVHGGGPQIGAMLQRLQIPSSFMDGLRVTDAETMSVVEMVLSGLINKQIVAAINQQGGFAVGLSGKDGKLIQATKLHHKTDLGYVGEPATITPHILDTFRESDIIPVIAPVGMGRAGESYNINADTAAGAVAGALAARRLLMLTDVEGVLDREGRLITEMTGTQAKRAIADGVIKGGMIPKIHTCLDAVERGVEAAVILDGRVPHVILLELFTTHGAGTLIRKG